MMQEVVVYGVGMRMIGKGEVYVFISLAVVRKHFRVQSLDRLRPDYRKYLSPEILYIPYK